MPTGRDPSGSALDRPTIAAGCADELVLPASMVTSLATERGPLVLHHLRKGALA